MQPISLPPPYTLRDWQRFAALDEAEIGRAAGEMCARLLDEAAEPGADRLVAMGIMLSTAAFPAAAGAVLDWSAAAPTPARLRIATGLLRGLWLFKGTGQCTDDRVARLLDFRDLRRPGEPERFGSACLLLRAAACGRRHAPRVAERLRTAFRADTGGLRGPLRERLRGCYPADDALAGPGDSGDRVPAGDLLTFADWRALDLLHQPGAGGRLAGSSRPAIAVFAEDLCETFAARYPDHDVERLVGLGATLPPVAREIAGEIALDLLEDEPAAARLEIACWLLTARAGLAADRAARLLACADRLGPAEVPAGTEYSFALAMSVARPADPAQAERFASAFAASLHRLPPPLARVLRRRVAAAREEARDGR